MDTVSVRTSESVEPAAPRDGLVLLTALGGSFIATMTAQFTGTNLADIQGGVGASADEVSWISTVYTMTSFVGIIVSGPFARTFGLRRYYLATAAIFAACAWLCTLATAVPQLAVLRGIQGVAAGGFGPLAFLAVFMLFKGPRLPFALSLLAFVLLVSVTAGPVLSGLVESLLGWRGLFLVQFWLSALMVLAGLAWLPRSALNWNALKTDWGAMALLAAGLAALMLVLNQGTRRFWLDNPTIAWATALCIGAWAGFFFMSRYSPSPILNPAKFLDRRFAIPIAMNLLFRASFAVTVYLVPQQLALTQGYRPLQTSAALLWCLLPQVAVFPLVWRVLQRVDGRVPMSLGLLLCAIGTGLAAFASNQDGAEQLHWTLALFGVGQMLFLVPDLLIGASSLKPEDLPTASLAFNATTLGGTTLGTGLVTNFVTEREKFHSNVLTEHVSWLDPLASDRLSALAGAITSRIGDETVASARAVGLIAGNVRREAWLLAINDAYALVAILIAVVAFASILIGRSPPLPRLGSPQGVAP
ncbi:MFS transporter [Lysobacter sp. TAF61]|uniref:MFS transporter n=1 Tax=Lysobacter sp. TAF61 TaxID=3233072 RepID=UPI003F9D228D